MKKTFLTLSSILVIACGYLHGQIKTGRTVTTQHGSFVSQSSFRSEVDKEKKSGATPPFAEQSVQTSGGGTSTLVRFNEKKSSTNKESVKFKSNNARVSIYPNPTKGEITIKYFIPKNDEAEFIISDLAGKKLASHLLQGENNQILISEIGLQPGIYMYHVLSDGQIVKQDKIVIIK